MRNEASRKAGAIEILVSTAEFDRAWPGGHWLERWPLL